MSGVVELACVAWDSIRAGAWDIDTEWTVLDMTDLSKRHAVAGRRMPVTTTKPRARREYSAPGGVTRRGMVRSAGVVLPASEAQAT